MFDKIKSILTDDRLFLAILLILTSVTSFGLGRLSLEEIKSSPQKGVVSVIESISEADHKSENLIRLNEKNFVASKNGSKYHLPDCPGAKQMSEGNKIYFSTEEEARSSGYTKAANCPGL